MIAALHAEFRKLYTVRSTYMLALVALLLGAVLAGFWIWGYKDVEHAALNHLALSNLISRAANIAGIFLSFLAVLLVGHEYRYNTITYSLTSTNNRSKVYLAKLFVLLVSSLVIAAIVIAAAIGLFHVGQHLHHITTASQQVPLWDTIWRSAATVAGGIVYAFIISIVLRNLIGSIAFILVVPTTVENLLSLLLKDNVKYLPYTALDNLTRIEKSTVSHSFSLAVVASYIAVFGVVSWLLFLKRDAN